MKGIYTPLLLLLLLIFAGCSKDILKSYDTRIVGTWRISNVNRFGIGGNTSNLPFNDGSVTFKADGTLTYAGDGNATFNGSWDIVKKTQNDQIVQSLQITAVDFNNQQVRTQYYYDMNFLGTDHFTGVINNTLHTYITHFRR